MKRSTNHASGEMHRYALIVLVIFNLISLQALAKDPDKLRIIGGIDSEPDAYPWMAAVVKEQSDPLDGQFCGGTLISQEWVLTAAHCIDKSDPSSIDVILGINDLEGAEDERIAVNEIVVNDSSESDDFDNLALLRLESPSTHTPVNRVQTDSDIVASGSIARTLGWGASDTADPNSKTTILQQADIPIVTPEACRSAFGDAFSEEEMICAGLPEEGKGSCNGDDGGPLLVFDGQSNEVKLAGVTGIRAGCSDAEIPGIYYRISTQNEWIDSVIGKSTPLPPDGPLAANFTFQCEAQSCDFDGTSSTSDVPIKYFIWNFGDGTWDFGDKVSHNYMNAGEFDVSLWVLAEDGRLAFTVNSVEVIDDSGSFEEFNGRIDIENSWSLTPASGSTVGAGTLTGRLQAPENADFDLYLVRFDTSTSDLEFVAASTEEGVMEEINFSGPAGTYLWMVRAKKGIGDFVLKLRHEPEDVDPNDPNDPVDPNDPNDPIDKMLYR